MTHVRTLLAATLLALGCGGDAPLPDPGAANVQWADRNGRTWFAPPVTPAPDDPLYQEHPEAGVVVIDRATRKKRIVKDPSDFVKRMHEMGGPPRWMFVREPVE